MKSQIKCLGQTTVKVIIGKKVIYFDPISADSVADYIFYSGTDLGYNEKVLKKIINEKTVVIAPSHMIEILSKFVNEKNLILAERNAKIDLNFKVNIIPAYKIDSTFSETVEKNNGYIISDGKESIYFSGPTDVIPEMNLIEANITILPVLGPFMDLFSALAATNVIKSDKFVPIAYADNEEEGLLFCKRFIKKCVYDSDLFRDEPVPEPKYLIE